LASMVLPTIALGGSARKPGSSSSSRFSKFLSCGVQGFRDAVHYTRTVIVRIQFQPRTLVHEVADHAERKTSAAVEGL
jgi:hypothetical protein